MKFLDPHLIAASQKTSSSSVVVSGATKIGSKNDEGVKESTEDEDESFNNFSSTFDDKENEIEHRGHNCVIKDIDVDQVTDFCMKELLPILKDMLYKEDHLRNRIKLDIFKAVVDILEEEKWFPVWEHHGHKTFILKVKLFVDKLI